MARTRAERGLRLHSRAAFAATHTSAIETLFAPADVAARWGSIPFMLQRQSGVVLTSGTTTGAIPTEGAPNTTHVFYGPAGSDTAGTGTRANPYKTPGKVHTLVVAGGALAVAGANVVAVQIGATADIVYRAAEGWNNAVAVANLYHVTETPQHLTISAKANGLNQQATLVSAGVYDLARATAPLAMVDATYKTRPWRLNSAGGGFTVGDVLTLSNGAVIQIIGVRTGEVASGVAGAVGALANWIVIKRAYLPVSGTVTVAGGTGTGVTFWANPTAPVRHYLATKAASLAAVTTGSGTWFDDGTVTRYAPPDGRVLDTSSATSEPKIILTVTGNNGRGSVTAGQITDIGAHFIFIGGSVGFNDLGVAGVGKRLVLRGGSIMAVTSAGNGLAITGDTTLFAENHWCYDCDADGHNGHAVANGTSSGVDFSRGLLLNCGGQGNGVRGSGTSDQALTVHEDCVWIVPGYQCYGSDDQPIVATNDALLWMPEIYCEQATQTTPLGSKQSIVALINARVWIDGGEVRFGLNARFDAQGTGQPRVLVRNLVGTVANDPADSNPGNGQVVAF